MTGADPDPILVRRRQLERLARLGKRVGYGCLGVAVFCFAAGLSSSYATWGTGVAVALAACTLTLAPAIVLGYAVKAADREDRESR